MKKIYSLLTISFIGLGIIFLGLSPSPKLYANTLINEPGLVPPFHLLAHYSDISYLKETTYALSPSGASKIKDDFLAYTEGFVNKKSYNLYKKSMLALNPELDAAMPHDIYEDETLAVFCFTGKLNAIYSVDKQTLKAHKLIYTPSQDLGEMYVSHIKKVDNHLIILGAQVKATNAFIYTVDLPTLTVLKSKQLPTHPHAINDKHYTITAKGECVFIDGYGLKIYNPFLDTTAKVNLPFEAAWVTASDSHLLISSYNLLEGLHYTYLDSSLALCRQGTFSLPSTSFELVDIILKDGYVYFISFDPNGLLYLNYLTIYHIPSEKMVYCLGLGSLLPKALIAIN